MKIKILAFAGSTREGSYNKKLVKLAAKGAQDAGAEVTFIDLKDFPMPLFDEDLEAAQGLPDAAKKLKKLMKDHHGFLIASPEYNSSLTAVLKNAIDWVSRKESDTEPNLECFTGKTAAIMSASPGGLGGLRGLVHLRAILENIGVLVLPNQVTVSAAYNAFNDDSSLKDSSKQAATAALGAALHATLSKLNQ